MGRPPGPSTVKIVTVADGAAATALRARYATTPRAQIDKDNLNYFAKLYPQITRTSPSIFLDNEAINRIEIDEFYTINGDWSMPPPDGGWWHFSIFSHNVDAAIRLPGASARSMPLGLTYPRHEIFRLRRFLP